MLDHKLLKTIQNLAVDEDWKVREEAATQIKKINDNHFEEYLPIWKQWISNPDPNIRRATLVGLVRVKKVRRNNRFY